MNFMCKLKSFSLISLFIANVATATTVKVMTYNVENLFDTTHDVNKDDYTYLPLLVKRNSDEVQNYCLGIPSWYQGACFNLNWDDKILKNKINNIAKVIKSENPDILVLEEVENINVLNKLVNIGLKNQGYKYVSLVEGPDSRGIDIGVISKFKFSKEVKLHHIDTASVDNNGKPDKETRGILEASFKINGKNITIFGNHWPSQSHPDESRVVAGKTLYQAINKKDDLVIALGDFNTVENDKLSGIDEYLLNESREHTFIDSETKFFNTYPESTNQRGTHSHQGKWGSLDHIFVLNNNKNISILWDSFKVVSHDYMFQINKHKNKVPFRFDTDLHDGYSDHLPVTISFSIK